MRDQILNQPIPVDDNAHLPKEFRNPDPQLLVEEWLGGRSHSWSTPWFDAISRAVFELLDRRVSDGKQLALRAFALGTTDLERAYALRLAAECELVTGNLLVATALIKRSYTLCEDDRWIKQTLARVLAATGHDELAREVDAAID